MKNFLCIILLAACLPVVARARIGETPEQVAARYGEPLLKDYAWDHRHPAERGNVYAKNGINICVVFFDGKAALEHFQKPKGETFSQEEVTVLLDANGPGEHWQTQAGAGLVQYVTPTLQATWYRGDAGRALVVCTQAYSRARQDAETGNKAAAEKNLRGF